MIEQSAVQSIFKKDLLPLYLQATRQINSLKKANSSLQEEVKELQLKIIDMESTSVEVKSFCARCLDQSLDQSTYDTDSQLYQKIFEKNFTEARESDRHLIDRFAHQSPYEKTNKVWKFKRGEFAEH